MNSLKDYMSDVSRLASVLSDRNDAAAVDARSSAKSPVKANVERNLAILSGILDAVSGDLAEMLAAIPERERKPRKRRCAGLPRTYPMFWMATPHSNSLRVEWRELEKLPNNGLKSWKE